MHQADAAILTQPLQFPAPEADRTVACPCGQQAHYQLRRPQSLVSGSFWRPGSAAGAVRKRRSSSAMGAEWIWNLASRMRYPNFAANLYVAHPTQKEARFRARTVLDDVMTAAR